MTATTGSLRSWCTTCGTRHRQAKNCPGELLATGVERHGWRGLADTPRGPEVYGTLVAPVEQGWRARILTFPNVLWVASDPRIGTLKFLGSSPANAEEQAIAYIRSICERRGFTLRTEVPTVESAAVDPEQAPEVSESEEVRTSQRALRRFNLLYGVDRPNRDAKTDDVSEGGLFIHTSEPLAVGTKIKLFLETPELGIPLRGVVSWAREEKVEGRPRGMGIRLIAPHPRYINFVRQQLNMPPADAARAPNEEETAIEEWFPGRR